LGGRLYSAKRSKSAWTEKGGHLTTSSWRDAGGASNTKRFYLHSYQTVKEARLNLKSDFHFYKSERFYQALIENDYITIYGDKKFPLLPEQCDVLDGYWKQVR
jgi:hypothetical protein